MWLPGRLALKNFQSLDCKVISVMPFQSNGKKYLTPVDAATTLINKIGAGDFVFCLMTTATTESIFVEKLKALSNIWALPDFKKALKISQTLTTLDENKMIIPAIDNSISSLPLTTPQTRQILASQKVGKVKSLSLANIKSNITQFENKQKQLVSNAISQATQGGNASIDVFYFFGSASDLKKDIPNETHVFTLMTAFTGEDIIKLIGLIA